MHFLRYFQNIFFRIENFIEFDKTDNKLDFQFNNILADNRSDIGKISPII